MGVFDAFAGLITNITNLLENREINELNYKRFLENRRYEAQREDEIDQRNYNRYLEQRDYDTPVNQMQRFTAAGLSEHAAAAALGAGSGGGIPVSSPPDSGQPPQAQPTRFDMPGGLDSSLSAIMSLSTMKEQERKLKLENDILEANKDNIIAIKNITRQRQEGFLTNEQYNFKMKMANDSLLLPDKDGNLVPGWQLEKRRAMESLKGQQYENDYLDKIAEMRVKRYKIDLDQADEKLKQFIKTAPVDLRIKNEISNKLSEEVNKLRFYNSDLAPILKEIAEEQLTKAKAQNWISHLTDNPAFQGALQSVVQPLIKILEFVAKFL